MMDKKSLHTQYRILCTIVIISLPTQGALHVVHLKIKTNVTDNEYEIVWKKLSTYENFIILFTYFFNNITDRRAIGELEIKYHFNSRRTFIHLGDSRIYHFAHSLRSFAKQNTSSYRGV